MTLLMTGGATFFGLHLVREHLLAGRHVTVLASPAKIPAYERIQRFLAADGASGRLPARLRDLLAVVNVDITHHSLGLTPIHERALAARATELWHVPDSVIPHRPEAEVRRTNVSGTENVLRFAAGLRQDAPLRYVSTAFVGARARAGTVREQHSAEVVEFDNAHERTKHLAEGLVRRWANRHGRGALIVRPSVLVPDGLPAGALPDHQLRILGRVVAGAVAGAPGRSARLVLRICSEPRAFLNLVQATWAARAMLRLATLATDPETRTVHLVHPTDTPVRSILRAVEDVLPVRLRMTPTPPAEPTDAEAVLYRRGAGFLPYLGHRRRYDDSALRGSGVELAPPPVIDRPDLRDILATDLAALRRSAGPPLAAAA